MAAGKKTPEPAAKNQKKKSIPGKIGAKQAAAASLWKLYTLPQFSILSQSTNGRHFAKLICHAEFLPNLGNLPIPIIMGQSFCFSSYKQQTREEPRNSMSRNPSRNPSSCNCTWQRVSSHMVFFLQLNTDFLSLAKSFYCWTHFELLSLLFLSVFGLIPCVFCSVEFGYENAWELLPKFSVVQHISLSCFASLIQIFLTWFAYIIQICLTSCLLLFLVQLSLSLIYFSFNWTFPQLLHYFSLIQMFTDLSMGTAAFLFVSNFQDPLTKLLVNTGSEYNFNCLATRKHDNTKLSDGKF